MSLGLPTREQAHALLTAHTRSENLLRHAYALEGVMRYIARKRGEDEEVWGVIGLVHDVDYEEHPDEHLAHAGSILEEAGFPDWAVRAVLSHGWGICTDVEPQTDLEKTLYAVDELTGLVAASALVRPTKSVMDMKPKSVKKKWKDKAFAAGVDRSIIEKGAEMLGVEVSELIADTIEGMREVAADIGLAGVPDA